MGLPTDKKLHNIVECVISAICGIVLSFVTDVTAIAVLSSLAFTMCIGVAKEIYDSKQNGNHFCKWDLLFDYYGASSGCMTGLLAPIL